MNQSIAKISGGKGQKHNHVGRGGGGHRFFAQQLPHPDRVDRAAQRLQHIRGQRRNGERDQGTQDRSLRQVAAKGGFSPVLIISRYADAAVL